jgi:pimeloyl-ACP methyl ester carboxylesterase
MGTPGVHPYLVGESEGRSGLDAALAARQLPDAHAGERLGIMGYSQGGHAAMWAAELAAEWAPELRLVGTFAGAPPTEIDLIVAAHITGAAATFEVLLVNGFEQQYGDGLDPAELLSPAGLRYLPMADQLCIGELSTELAGFGADAYVADPDPRWAARAVENNAGTRVVDSPLLIIHSSSDDVVPPVLSDIATQRLCGLGQVVERRTPDLGRHGEAAIPAYAAALTWMQDRFAPDGPPPTTTCSG